MKAENKFKAGYSRFFDSLKKEDEPLHRKIVLADKDKKFLKPYCGISALAMLFYTLLVDQKTENLIILLLLFLIPYIVDGYAFFRGQAAINEKRYLDLKKSLLIITNNMIYKKDAWYNGGRWSSDEIKAELKFEKQRWPKKTNRDLSKIELQLWMLYIRTNNFDFCEMLMHLLSGRKVIITHFEREGRRAIIFKALNDKCDYEDYCFRHISSIELIENENDSDSELKEYKINNATWVYKQGVIDEILYAIGFDCTKTVDLEERKPDCMGYSFYKPKNIVYEICNGENLELSEETSSFREEVKSYYAVRGKKSKQNRWSAPLNNRTI
jgi:hypothetical protein